MVSIFFIYLITLLAPFTELLRFPLGPSMYIRIMDLIVLIYVLFGLPRLFKPKILKRYLALWIFIGALLLSNLFNLSSLNLIGSAYLFRTLFYLLLLPIMLEEPLLNKISKVIKFLVLFCLYVLLTTSLLQLALYPNLRNLYYLGYDPHLYRLFGFFLDPNLIGIVLAWGAIYFLVNLKNKYYMISFALFTIALLFTYSRISWLVFLIGLGYYFWLTKKRLFLLLGLGLLFIISMIFLPKRFGEGTNILRTNSIVAKQQTWKKGFNVIKKQPVFGIGFNNVFLYKKSGLTPDNSMHGLDSSLLTVFVTTGLVGLVTYGYLFLRLFQKSNQWQKIIVLLYFIHALSTNSFFTPGVFVFFVLFMLVSKIDFPKPTQRKLP